MGKVTTENAPYLVRGKKVNKDQKERIENVACAAETMLETIIKNCPESADTSHALRQVRDAKMWATEAIANKGAI